MTFFEKQITMTDKLTDISLADANQRLGGFGGIIYGGPLILRKANILIKDTGLFCYTADFMEGLQDNEWYLVNKNLTAKLF